MNAILKSKKDAAAAQLADLSLPNDWRRPRAKSAMSWLRDHGLPSKRDHFWSYTDPAMVLGATGDATADVPAFDGVNLTADLQTRGAGYAIAPLAADALENYGDIVARAHEKGERPFAELALANAEGLVLNATGEAGAFTLNHADFTGNYLRINVAAGASLTLIERITKADQRNILIEADLAEGAKFDHIRIAPALDDRLMLQLFADIGKDADLRSFNLIAPSTFRRFETVVNLNGDNGHFSVSGANWLNQKAFHDDTVYVTHNAEHCTSRQVFKRVIGAGAQSIFQGKIYVKEGAQKTDGYQISQGLMLEDGGEALSKPELEIYADDVACSHGSTTSGLDETALFYLRSRGVSRPMAEKLLVRAFLQEAFEEIRDESYAETLAELAENWIFGQAL